MTLALLFPGQGAQHPGMLAELPDAPAIAATLAEARPVLADLGLTGVVDGTSRSDDTVDIQVGLLLVEVSCSRALREATGTAPAFVAGHSAGGYAAAVAAGVLTLTEALVALQLRGTLMRQACAGRNWGMAALTGLPVRTAQRVVDETTTDAEPLWVANVNAATQTVIGGTATALAAAEAATADAGARAFRRLDVPVASHGPVQADTAEHLVRHLATVPRRTPTARYLTNVGGRAVDTAEAVHDDLARSVAHPVRWYDATRLMAELGVTQAIESAPGHVLTRLWSSAVPDVRCAAVADTGYSAAPRTRWS